MNRVHVIKIGGKVIDDEDKLDAFLKSFIKIKEHKILIHGGGDAVQCSLRKRRY